ncbi:MAG: GNAT family N-acetyltransferase [Syntrophobacteraceae bacterium]
MDHSIIVQKFGIRLRPVGLSDAGFIVNLRNSPHALGFVGDSAQTEASQRDWLNSYFARPGDYYFIVELARNCQMVGTSGIYDIQDGSGEGGRWIILPGIPAAPASSWLTYHISFDILGLDVVRGTVVESNKNSISFHKKIGIHVPGDSKPRIIAGEPVNMLEWRVTRAEWPLISANLTRYALIAEKVLAQDNP